MAISTDLAQLVAKFVTKDYEKGLKKMEKETKKSSSTIGKSIGSIKTGYVAAVAAVVGFAAAVRGSISAYMEADQAQRMLQLTFKETGETAKFNYKLLKEQSKEFQRTSIYNADQILASQANLGRLAKITQNDMKRVTRSMLNFATVRGKTITEAGTQFAKIFTDMNAATSKLGELDIVLTKQQKDRITGLAAMGDEVGAFNAMLEIMEDKWSGVSETAAEGTGIYRRLGNAFGDLNKELGKLAHQVLEPVAKAVLRIVEGLTSFMQKHEGTLKFIANVLMLGLPYAATRLEGGKTTDAQVLAGQRLMAGGVGASSAGPDRPGWFSDFYQNLINPQGVEGGIKGIVDAASKDTPEAGLVLRWGQPEPTVAKNAEEKAALDAANEAARELANEAAIEKEEAEVEAARKEFDGRHKQLTKMEKLENEIRDVNLKKTKAAVEIKVKLAQEYAEQEMFLIKKVDKMKQDALDDEKKRNISLVAHNLRSLKTMFKDNKVMNKALLALEKSHLLATLVPRIRADAAAAFSATMKTSGFWGIAAAWTAFAMTAAQMGSAVASIRSMSTGGLVPGVAGAGDVVPAWLQPGENVETRSQVAARKQAEAEAQASGDSASTVRLIVEPAQDLGKMFQFAEEDRINEGF